MVPHPSTLKGGKSDIGFSTIRLVALKHKLKLQEHSNNDQITYSLWPFGTNALLLFVAKNGHIVH